MPLRCVIVDDSPSFLETVRELLERDGIPVPGTASTSAEALRLVDEAQPDIALVAIDLAEEGGFDLAVQLAGGNGEARARAILISTRKGDFADLIDSSPAVGFVSDSELSANAIYAILSESPGR